MANTILTADVIAGEALDVLRNNAVMPNLVYRDYSGDFVPGVGETISVRKPATFVANEYAGTLTVQDATEAKDTVTMDKHLDVSFAVTSKEMTMSIEDFSAQFLTPAMQAFLDKVDGYLIAAGVAAAKKTVATSAAVTQANIVAARQAIVQGKAPTTDRNFVFGPQIEADLLSTELFVNAAAAGDTAGLQEASIGRKFGLDCYTDQNCGNAQGTEDDGLVFHKNALALVTRPLELPQGAANASVANYDGFGIRVVYGYDMQTKTDTVSLDMLCGVKALYPELVSVIKRTVAAA